MGKKWSNEEINILSNNYGKIHISEIISNSIINRTKSAIKNKAQKMGFNGNPIILNQNKRLSSRKYTINFNYFKIPNLYNSYWAGFIAADGCLYDPKKKLRFNILYSDKYLLDEFRLAVDFSGNIKKQSVSHGQDQAVLDIFGVYEWFIDLKNNFNIVPKKSLILMPPYLGGDNAWAFIKGYIDGDGSICICNNNIRISIVGTLNMMLWIQNIFRSIIEDNTKIYKHANIYQYIVAKKDNVKKVLEKIKSFPLPGLRRKWDKYNV